MDDTPTPNLASSDAFGATAGSELAVASLAADGTKAPEKPNRGSPTEVRLPEGLFGGGTS